MIKGMFRTIFAGLLMIFFAFTGMAQNQSSIYWYFGNSGNGFRFIRPDYNAEGLTIPRNLGQGMSAVATDPVSGVVLFYTDGQNVYDREHNVMPNGTGLLGNPNVNQGVAISAKPGDPGLYYIFTHDGSAIRVTTVDMSLNSPNAEAIPLGDVTVKNQPVNGLGGSYDPGMIVLSNNNLTGFWLIAHQQASTNYVSIDINAAGFTPSATASITNAPTVVDNFSFNGESGLLGIAPQSPTENAATVSFNTSTGQFGGSATAIPGTSGSTQTYNIYDTEWSADGRFFYLSGNFNGANDQLMQIDFTESPLTLRPVPTQNMQRSYGLQMAPDSSIYHLYRHSNGSFRVGRINDPDTIAAQTRYTANAFGGNTNYQGRQFPAFLPPTDPMITATIQVAGTCANVPSLFFPTIEPGADSVRWDFGDGNGSRDLAPFHTYAQGGAYSVSLWVYLNGDSTAFGTTTNITQFDLQISGFPDSDTVCAEDFPVEYTAEAQSGSGGNQGPQPTFRWSNQMTDGATTLIDSAGNYYVTAFDQQSGCTAYQALRVVEYRAIEQRAFVWYFGEHAGIDFNPVVDVDNPGPARPI
ncbi:MAG: PKD domain-containing protein, partial [Cyclobacteriaceae bacterium]